MAGQILHQYILGRIVYFNIFVVSLHLKVLLFFLVHPYNSLDFVDFVICKWQFKVTEA